MSVVIPLITFPNNNTKSPTIFTATTRKMLRAIRKKAHLAALQNEYPKIAVCRYSAESMLCYGMLWEGGRGERENVVC